MKTFGKILDFKKFHSSVEKTIVGAELALPPGPVILLAGLEQVRRGLTPYLYVVRVLYLIRNTKVIPECKSNH